MVDLAGNATAEVTAGARLNLSMGVEGAAKANLTAMARATVGNPLEVETGSGSATSESLISVEEFLAYHANRGNAIVEAKTELQIEQALRRTADYMRQKYFAAWKGSRTYDTQALDWPRSNVDVNFGNYWITIDQNTIPGEIKNAWCDVGLKALSGELISDEERKTIEETIGPITVRYDNNAVQQKRYPAIDMLLKPYLKTSYSSVTMGLVRS